MHIKKIARRSVNYMWLPVTKRGPKASASRLDADCCNGTIDCRCAASTVRVILSPVLFLRATDGFFIRSIFFIVSLPLELFFLHILLNRRLRCRCRDRFRYRMGLYSSGSGTGRTASWHLLVKLRPWRLCLIFVRKRKKAGHI